MEITDSDLQFLKNVLNKDKGVITSSTLSTLLEAFSKTDRAFIKELPLELALIKILSNEK